MATDTNFTSPPRQGNYRSGRRKMWIILLVIAALAGAVIGSWYWLGGSPPPPPKHREASNNRGVPWQGQAEPAVARQPAPKAEPRKRITQSFAGTSAVADPAIMAPIAVTNQFSSQKSFISQEQGQQAVKSSDEDAGEDGEDNALSASLKRSNLGPKSVGHIDRDYLYTISAGRHLPCNMTTKINTQLPGFVTCDIQGDVYNDSGTGLLLRNGTHVFGEYKSALLHGNDRAFLLWRKIRTDDTPACKIEINSPAADALGAAGKPVIANEHFWETFWATAVYTALEAGPALAIAALQSNNRNNNNNNALQYYQLNQLTGPAQSMGSRMLQERMNRPPTGEANPGEPLMIFVGTDINMKKCVRFDLREAGR